MNDIQFGSHAAILQLVAEQLRSEDAAAGKGNLEDYSRAIESVAAALICGQPATIAARG